VFDGRGAGRCVLPEGTGEFRIVEIRGTPQTTIVPSHHWVFVISAGNAHGRVARRKARRTQPVGFRGLRQLVAEHHRHHQQQRRTGRRAAGHADRPERVSPVQ